MSNSDIHLCFEAKNKVGIQINVSLRREEEIVSYTFISSDEDYGIEFLLWLRLRTDKAINKYTFSLFSFNDSAFRIYSTLYSSGAAVCLLSD